MNEEQLKIVITADTQDFIKDVKNVQKEVKNTGKVLEDASADITDFTGEFDDLGKELKDAKQEYINVAKTFGASSKEAQEAAKRISELSTEHMNAKKHMEQLTRAADSFDTELIEMDQAAAEAAAEMARMAKETEEAGKKADALEEHLKSAKDTCVSAMKGMATAIAGALASVIALSESTRELRNNQSKLQTAFESSGRSAESATKVYDDLYRVLGDDGQATEAAAHLAKLSATQEELSEWTDICMGVYSQFGASLPLEGLTEAINHTAQLGEVQGTLADALEWSGITVDDFNEQLTKCNTQSEREKLIRDTLNGVYKTSADRYKENNKEIMDANDAQNRMNKALSNLGKIMEPVNSELKSMGASLLEDLAEPMADVAKFLTGTLFPAIKATYGWMKDNMPIVKGVVVALTVAYAAHKIMAYKTKLEEEGLTLAIIARTAAQKALNAVMKLNPWGLAIAGVAGLATGLISLFTKEEETTTQTQELTDATVDYSSATAQATEVEDEFVVKMRETTDALAEQRAEIDESTQAINALYGHNKALADELLRLADANGKVQESDEARVGFILGQLNEAYGTEYQMVDGVIQQYDELRDSIYEVIEAKTAQSMLEAHNEAYIEAIENEQAALGDVLQAERDMVEQKKIVGQTEQELADLRATLNDKTIKLSENEIFALVQQMQDKQKALLEEQNILREKEGAYDESLLVYQNYYKSIGEYEEAAALVQEGKYQEAIDMLRTKGKAYFDYADDVDKATQEAIDALFKEAVDAGLYAEQTKKNFEDGVEGYTAEMVAEAETGYEDALSAWANAYSDAAGVGGDLGDGVFDGLGGKLPSLKSKAASIITSMISSMRSAADSHSPSRKTMSLGEDMGEGAEIGISKTTKSVVKASQDMISKSINAMRGLSALNFKNTVSSSTMSANAMPVASHAMETAETATLLSAIGSKIGENTPIILQVDGKVFAQTAVNTMNARFKQQGKVDLAYI